MRKQLLSLIVTVMGCFPAPSDPSIPERVNDPPEQAESYAEKQNMKSLWNEHEFLKNYLCGTCNSHSSCVQLYTSLLEVPQTTEPSGVRCPENFQDIQTDERPCVGKMYTVKAQNDLCLQAVLVLAKCYKNNGQCPQAQ